MVRPSNLNFQFIYKYEKMKLYRFKNMQFNMIMYTSCF